MKATLSILALALSLAATAQELPPVPDEHHPDLGYWHQPKPLPNLAAPAAAAGFGLVLSAIFANSESHSLNDLSPAVAITGLAAGAGILAIEIGTTKERKWIKRAPKP